MKLYQAVSIDEEVGTLHERTAVLCSTYVAFLSNFKIFCLTFITAYVPALTLRRLMSYIYGAPILDVSRSHTTTQHSR